MCVVDLCSTTSVTPESVMCVCVVDLCSTTGVTPESVTCVL